MNKILNRSNTMSPSPIDILNTRLASGEITLTEYQDACEAIRNSSNSPQHAIASSINVDFGHLVFSFENLRLHELGFLNNGQPHQYEEIERVVAGGSSKSFNLVPTEKTSWCTVRLKSGEVIKFNEDRIFFGRANHKAIMSIYSHFRTRSYRGRMKNLIGRLIENDWLSLGFVFTGSTPQTVYLTSDGHIICEEREIDIKNAAATGTFGCGTVRVMLGGSRYSDPNEIIISEKKIFLRLIPKDAIKFKPINEDIDVLNELLEWFSKPGNYI